MNPHEIAISDIEQLHVGVKSLDEQHQVLFSMIDSLHHAAITSSTIDFDFIHDLAFGLIAYAQNHFKFEEGLMLPGYLDGEKHHEMHRMVLKELSKFEMRALWRDPDVAADLSTFLRIWLTHHIATMDRHLGEFLNTRGVFDGSEF